MFFNRLFGEPKDKYLTPKGALCSEELYKTFAYTEFWNEPLAVTLGDDDFGNPILLDIQKAPHILIGGTPGSGKSVCINNIICQLLNKLSPNQLTLVIVDPKDVDMMDYEHIPHTRMYAREVNEIEETVDILNRVMDDRYKDMHDQNVNHNQKLKEPYPFILFVYDEFGSDKLSKDTLFKLSRIIKKGRACNIHCLLCTQRPDRSVIDSQLKANCPTRLAFRLSTAIDSRIVLDTKGAETLNGNGDGLMKNEKGLSHFHGYYYSDEEVKKICDFWSQQPFTMTQALQERDRLDEITPQL